jgi:hypothetical protein
MKKGILVCALAMGLAGCGTLDLVGHARIHNDLLYPTGNPGFEAKSAYIVEVDGQAARSAPLPSLFDLGAHPAAWVSGGRHLFRISVTSSPIRPGVSNPTEYVTFSATVQSGKDYGLCIVDNEPVLVENGKKAGTAVP